MNRPDWSKVKKCVTVKPLCSICGGTGCFTTGDDEYNKAYHEGVDYAKAKIISKLIEYFDEREGRILFAREKLFAWIKSL
jgi:hypothetical protein